MTKSLQKTPSPAPQYNRFTELTKRLLGVSKKELDEKAAEYQKKKNPKRRK